MSLQDKIRFFNRPQTRTNRLTKYEVEEAHCRRTREIYMWSIIREILTHLCFLWLVYAITYSNQNDNAFLQVNHLRQFFLNTGQSHHDYTKIVSINDYWDWLEESFVSNIRAQEWYNDGQPRGLKGFINDKSNRMIRWATMRQLRVQPKSCQGKSAVGHLNLTCKNDYSLFNEEQRSFQPGWVHQTPTNYSTSIQNAFLYKTSKQLHTYVYVGNHETYGSGGYVYDFRGRLSDLRSNLSQLHQLGWIDDQTRAVIIQCTLYNPNAQIFTSVTFLAELLATGGIIPTARFEPINFQDSIPLSYGIISILYIAFIVYLMVLEMRSFSRLKFAYFRQLWSYFEWGIIGCSWAGLGVYVWRYRELTRISGLFQKKQAFAYVNMQLATYLNDPLTSLLGFCCFFGTIKLLRFCRFHRRLSLSADTLRHAAPDLLLFSLAFSFVFLAFLVLFYLLFVSKIWACSSLLHTAQMLFEMILLKFDATEIRRGNTYLGPLCFTLFIFFVVFIGMTMFISIIQDSFRTVRKKSQGVYDENHEMFAFMWDKFKRWTGIKKPDEWELQETRDKRMRSEYHDPIERFPEKVDQLLEALSKIKISKLTELSHEETMTSAKMTRRRRSTKTEI